MLIKGEIAGLSNFFFCHYVFRKTSAAKASRSVYMRERVNLEYLFTLEESALTTMHHANIM